MIDLALPKGSLEEQTLALFKKADLEVKRSLREYTARVDDPRIGKVKILRPQEIPKYVEEGYFDLGISGQDWVRESRADVVEVCTLAYSKQSSDPVRVVLAVPIESPVEKPENIDPDSRVTTEYPNLTEEYFKKLGIPVSVFFSYGATEAKVPDLMDVIVDLTETGTTLRRHGLKIIGTIMESSTVLIANEESWNDPEKRGEMEDIKTLLLGVVEARGKVLLDMNVPGDRLKDIIDALPAMKNPTVSQLYNSDYYAVETVVDKKDVNVLIPKLKNLGAEDILELDISKIIR